MPSASRIAGAAGARPKFASDPRFRTATATPGHLVRPNHQTLRAPTDCEKSGLGDLTIVEMKRDKAPREAIAQILDYGAWVKNLTTPRLHSIANAHLHRPLSEAFFQKFGQTIPETLNASHNLLIVASGFDSSSRRIVEYLSETYGVSINAAFFTYFRDNGNELLACDFLLDQEQVVTRRVTERGIRLSDDQDIAILQKDNPYKPGTKSHRRFEILQTSNTVGDFRKTVIAEGLANRDGYEDLRFAERRRYIRIGTKAKSPANSG